MGERFEKIKCLGLRSGDLPWLIDECGNLIAANHEVVKQRDDANKSLCRVTGALTQAVENIVEVEAERDKLKAELGISSQALQLANKQRDTLIAERDAARKMFEDEREQFRRLLKVKANPETFRDIDKLRDELIEGLAHLAREGLANAEVRKAERDAANQAVKLCESVSRSKQSFLEQANIKRLALQAERDDAISELDQLRASYSGCREDGDRARAERDEAKATLELCGSPGNTKNYNKIAEELLEMKADRDEAVKIKDEYHELLKLKAEQFGETFKNVVKEIMLRTKNRNAEFLDGLKAACKLVCRNCRENDIVACDEHGVWSHHNHSYGCPAKEIYDRIAELEAESCRDGK